MNIYRKDDIPDHLQKYFEPAEIGLEETPELYVEKMVQVFREVRRVLRDDGTLWLNLGDSYATNHYSDGHTFDRKYNGKNRDNGYPNKGTPELRTKNLIGIPWRIAFALQADGWYLRQDIIWHKPNPMPESVKDRCTKAHEYIFLLSKSPKYYYDYEAIKEPAAYLQANSPESIKSPYGQGFTRQAKGNRKSFRGGGKYTNNQSFDNSIVIMNQHHGNNINETGTRNKRSVWTVEDHNQLKEWLSINHPDIIDQFTDIEKPDIWTVSTAPFPGSHFATFPPDLIEPCILAGSPRGGIVLDCFGGAGTTGVVSLKNGRHYILIELKPEYGEMSENRIKYGTVDEEEIEEEKKQGVLF